MKITEIENCIDRTRFLIVFDIVCDKKTQECKITFSVPKNSHIKNHLSTFYDLKDILPSYIEYFVGVSSDKNEMAWETTKKDYEEITAFINNYKVKYLNNEVPQEVTRPIVNAVEELSL